MKKSLLSLAVVIISLFIITGCTTFKSYTYSVETGDKIKVKLETSGGYDMTSSLPFTISKDGSVLSTSTFIKGEYYDQYIQTAKSQGVVLDEGKKDSIEYLFYSYNDKEYNYIIKVNDSNTALLIGNPHSKEEAEEVFNRITISLEK